MYIYTQTARLQNFGMSFHEENRFINRRDAMVDALIRERKETRDES